MKRQAELEVARMRERMHRRAVELKEQAVQAEFTLPYEAVGYGFEDDDPKLVFEPLSGACFRSLLGAM